MTNQQTQFLISKRTEPDSKDDRPRLTNEPRQPIFKSHNWAWVLFQKKSGLAMPIAHIADQVRVGMLPHL